MIRSLLHASFFKAYLALVLALEWREYTILYENTDGLVRLQELLKYPNGDKEAKVSVKQLTPALGNDYRYH